MKVYHCISGPLSCACADMTHRRPIPKGEPHGIRGEGAGLGRGCTLDKSWTRWCPTVVWWGT